MKEEIKEILNYLKKKENTRRIKCITIEESKQLLDYITNLQENKHLDKVNCHLRKKINNDIYKQRNEKAIEYCDREIGNIIANFDYVDTKDLQNIKNILKGDKDEI